MAGGDQVDPATLKGLNKYFNGVTEKGRANITIATYSVIGLFFFYRWATKPKAPKEAAK